MFRIYDKLNADDDLYNEAISRRRNGTSLNHLSPPYQIHLNVANSIDDTAITELSPVLDE